MRNIGAYGSEVRSAKYEVMRFWSKVSLIISGAAARKAKLGQGQNAWSVLYFGNETHACDLREHAYSKDCLWKDGNVFG